MLEESRAVDLFVPLVIETVMAKVVAKSSDKRCELIKSGVVAHFRGTILHDVVGHLHDVDTMHLIMVRRLVSCVTLEHPDQEGAESLSIHD